MSCWNLELWLQYQSLCTFQVLFYPQINFLESPFFHSLMTPPGARRCGYSAETNMKGQRNPAHCSYEWWDAATNAPPRMGLRCHTNSMPRALCRTDILLNRHHRCLGTSQPRRQRGPKGHLRGAASGPRKYCMQRTIDMTSQHSGCRHMTNPTRPEATETQLCMCRA